MIEVFTDPTIRNAFEEYVSDQYEAHKERFIKYTVDSIEFGADSKAFTDWKEQMLTDFSEAYDG